MSIEEVVEYINSHDDPVLSEEMNSLVMAACYQTHRLTMQLNNSYHDPGEIRAILSEITGKAVPESLNMFPPFYTDFGRNIHFGQNIFVNDCCHFQDQGGIFIGDNVLIGHNTVLATIDHDLDPQSRQNHYAPICIGNNVWIGSSVVITKEHCCWRHSGEGHQTSVTMQTLRSFAPLHIKITMESGTL